MKKLYVTPEIEIIDTELSGMLCISTPIGNDADGPGHARALDWEDEEFDW